jgi:hypothetical protein
MDRAGRKALSLTKGIDRDLKFDLDLDHYSQEELSKLVEKPIKKIHCE